VVVGAPVILAEGSGAVSASTTGLVAYWKSVAAGGKRQLQWRSRTGAGLGSIGEPDGTYSNPRVSPDGRRIAVTRGESGKDEVWLLEGERTSRLTFSAPKSNPVWSPDGTRVAFGSSRPGAAGLYQKSADGSGEEQLLMKADLFAAPNSWSPDGRNLMYVYLGSAIDLGVLPTTGDRKSRAFLDSQFVEGNGEFSPDGKWMAYQSNESGVTQVYIRPFVESDAADATPAANAGKWQVSTAGGVSPRWGQAGKELFFVNPAGDMMAAPIAFTGSAVTAGTPVKLFQARVVDGGENQAGPQYDVARDGRFLINTVLETAAAESSPIILIQNWNPAAGK
jgi:Tol biopolymer transport system component